MSRQHHRFARRRTGPRGIASRRLVVSVLCIGLSLAVAACGSSSSGSGSSESSSGESVSVAYINPYTGNNFQNSFECGIREAAEKDGNVDLSVQGASEFSPEKEIPIINAMAASQPDAMILVATDSKALAAPLKQLTSEGTTVVVYDSLLADESIPAGQVGSDNEGGGEILGKTIVEKLGGKGTVLPVGLAPGVASTDAREAGVLKVLEEAPGITILPTQYDSLNPQKDAQIVNAALAANPELTAIVPTYDNAATGVLSALRGQHQNGKVKIFSFDGDANLIKAVETGEIESLVSQQVYEEAEKTLEVTLDAVAGKQVPKLTEIPMIEINKENVKDPSVKGGFYVSEPCT
jgi:ribose transport system substrate-binding protein